jgi:hypothetical protein
MFCYAFQEYSSEKGNVVLRPLLKSFSEKRISQIAFGYPTSPRKRLKQTKSKNGTSLSNGEEIKKMFLQVNRIKFRNIINKQ